MTRIVEPLSIEQGGFRAKRGCTDQILTLNEWIKQSMCRGKPRFMAFLDIKAAYDQVDRNLLWAKCRSRGVPANLIRVLKSLFDDNQSFVAINGKSSEPFPILSGLLQGSLLSPLLYSVFIDDLVEDLNTSAVVPDFGLEDHFFRCLLYADDIVLLANSRRKLAQLLGICEAHSITNRYRFNVSKCELIMSTTTKDAEIALMLYQSHLPVSQRFCYLGCSIDSSGIHWKSHHARLGGRALANASLLCSAGLTGRSLGPTAALRLFKVFIRPILEYCLSICPRKHLNQLKSYYNKAICWMSSAGKGACADVLGLFGACEPFLARHEKLGYSLMRRIQQIHADRGSFAVSKAYSAHLNREARGSLFAGLEDNYLIRKRRIAWLTNRNIPDDQLPSWKDRIDELLEELTLYFKSAFIFGGLSWNELRSWLKPLVLCPVPIQRAIFLYVLNRSAGPWKSCRHCRLLPATKAHLEACALGLNAAPIGPSLLEDRLHASKPSIATFTAIGTMITTCVGEHPLTEPTQ
jgi:Reverse transcriptase (RNA-dependent DNA polymerase)